MAYPELPHLAAPFKFTAGVAVVLEQDSVEEIAACVYNVAVCPLGFRLDEPDFGLPDPTFSPAPVDTGVMEAALARWEPRADLTLTEHAQAVGAAYRTVTVDVEASD